MNFQFKNRQKYTLINNNVFTSRSEIDTLETDPVTGRTIFKRGRERKRFLVPVDVSEKLVFEGHKLDFLLDSETNLCVGNCRVSFFYVFITTHNAILNVKCLNKSYSNFKMILVGSAKRSSDDLPDDGSLFSEEELNALFTPAAGQPH
jgi:hypothetical protein